MGGWDNERAEEKKRELINTFRDGLLSQGFNEAHISEMEKKNFSNGVYISPPEKPDTTLHFITMNSFSSSSRSTKPGNIRINLVDFLESIGTGVMTFSGGLAYPWLYLIGFTLLWKQLLECATIEIGEKENKVLWAIWELRNEKEQITFDNILKKVSTISNHYNIPRLKKGEVTIALENLENINAIKKNEDKWRIVECIRVSFA